MMKRSILRLAVVSALAAPAAWAQSDHQAMHHGAPASDPFARAMAAGMEKMMRDMRAGGGTGNPDVDFLAMMIPHHEGAVEMARLELVYGRDPLTRRLAQDIIASQTAEIGAMKNRIAILRNGEDPNPGGFPALEGTRGGGK